ncbi:MAG: esterase [Microbacteriaceae bacterium]|nr:esterase [Microbacteriaceae bacterium]
MSSSLPPFDKDAVVWSVGQAGRTEALESRPLLVLMHGRGSHERDLFSLVPMLPENAVVAALRAPIPLGDGYSWFPVGTPGQPSLVAADAVTEQVLEWLDTLPRGGPIWLMGFSQGGCMATHLMRHAPDRFSAYVNLSGFVIPGERHADHELETHRPPMFWGRDVADPVIPQDAIDRTAAWLPSHSSLVVREYAGIGHSISREEMDDVSDFLTGALRA